MKFVLMLVGALIGVLFFLLSYVTPVVMLSIFMAGAFNTTVGVITGIAFTALYVFLIVLVASIAMRRFGTDGREKEAG